MNKLLARLDGHDLVALVVLVGLIILIGMGHNDLLVKALCGVAALVFGHGVYSHVKRG